MPRVLIPECKQEVSSFNPTRSRYDDFRILRGPKLFDYHRSVREETGGALAAFDADPTIELVAGLGAAANTSGGVLSASCFQRLSGEFWEARRVKIFIRR